MSPSAKTGKRSGYRPPTPGEEIVVAVAAVIGVILVTAL